MKTRQMVDKSFSQHMIYQVFRAITHDIFNDKTWFPTSRCSCEDVFYEVFCIVDKMMFSHTDTESRLAFVEGIGQYEKNYVDEDEYATAQDERQRIVFVILYMAAVILQMMPLESKVFQFCSMIMGQWRGYVTQEFSQRCLGAAYQYRNDYSIRTLHGQCGKGDSVIFTTKSPLYLFKKASQNTIGSPSVRMCPSVTVKSPPS